MGMNVGQCEEAILLSAHYVTFIVLILTVFLFNVVELNKIMCCVNLKLMYCTFVNCHC